MLLLKLTAWLALLASPAAAGSLNRKAACNADNCLRAVIASSAKPGSASASQDCASFFARTVTPCPATSTATTTVTFYPPASPTNKPKAKRDAGLEGRQATTACPATGSPTAVPTYASACSGTARYSSACSCINAPRSTVTASQSTITTTVTTTVTATPTPEACFANPLCAASGFGISSYSNGHAPAGYPSSDPSSYYFTQNLPPLGSSVTNVTYFPYATDGGSQRQVNGNLTVNADTFTLVYQGLFRAPATGNYQFCTSADNGNDFFIGSSQAFSCANGQPSASAVPLMSARGANYDNPYVCGNINLIQGAYYPFRSVMGNDGGPSEFDLEVYLPSAPDGTHTPDFSGSAYPMSCGIYV